jgi:predicted TIM-barrel fold metal-dependent hydrolase
MGSMAIISVDGHVRASREGYRAYVPKRHLDAFDDWARAEASSGRPDAGNMQPRLPVESQWEPGRRLRDLESQGVVAEVLFPNGVPFQANQFEDGGQANDPELTRAGRAIYMRWLADFCTQAPGRFSGQAPVVFDDIGEAVRDVYWAKEHGLGGIMMPGLFPGGRYFFDPALDPVWAAIQETGLPVSQHGGAGAPQYTPAGMAAILTLAYEQAFFSGRSLWQMIVGGVFDRFPELKVVFTETQAYWIGVALDQFDRRVLRGDDWTAFAAYLNRERAFSRLPSEYWAANCYAGISPFHPSQLPLGKLGSGYDAAPGEFALRGDQVMFGVDYPHFESIYPSTMDQVAALLAEPAVTAADAEKILFGNAARVYGFDPAVLRPHVERVGFTPQEPTSGWLAATRR